MSQAWAAALDDLHARVVAFEGCLQRGDLEGFPQDWRQPPDLGEPPTPQQRARAGALLARARACEHRLADHLRAVAGQLHALRARSDAASSYHDASADRSSGAAQPPAEVAPGATA